MEDSTVPCSFGPSAWKPLAAGFEAFFRGDEEAVLTVYTDVGEPETMPVATFFRTPEQLRGVDRAALSLVRGRVLDIGAGVGSVSLALQESGFRVTAVEVIPEAAAIMRERGVREVLVGSVLDLPSNPNFDTLLLLMNGVALAGTLAGLGPLLESLEGLLAPGGQVLLDSTDLLADGSEESWDDPEEFDCSGELQYQVEFKGEKGAPFPQLFLDAATLGRVAGELGWEMQPVWVGEDGEYLARLTRQRGHESPDPLDLHTSASDASPLKSAADDDPISGVHKV